MAENYTWTVLQREFERGMKRIKTSLADAQTEYQKLEDIVTSMKGLDIHETLDSLKEETE